MTSTTTARTSSSSSSSSSLFVLPPTKNVRGSLWELRHRRKSTIEVSERRISRINQTTFHLSEYNVQEIFAIGKLKPSDERNVTIITNEGQQLDFELMEAVNKKPDKTHNLNVLSINTNVSPSKPFDRMRVWILRYDLWIIIAGYLAMFLLLNVVFAILWYIPDTKCCGDSTMTFGQTLNFAIQTSTTLGYGSFEPVGTYQNILVTLNFFCSLTLHALFAGIVFLKFVTPNAKMVFSDIMTLCNVNGLPCLQIRLGNADGGNIPLMDVRARFTYHYNVGYEDEYGRNHHLMTQGDLNLLVDWRYDLNEVWTLRHVIDETSPLFGVLGVDGLQDDIVLFQVAVTGMQDPTKMHVSAVHRYKPDHILIGYRFEDQLDWNPETFVAKFDYSKMNGIIPQPVWHPVSKNNPARNNRKSSATTINDKYQGGGYDCKEGPQQGMGNDDNV